MNKSKIIGGIICLVIAGVLVVANLKLPPEALMFQVGNIKHALDAAYRAGNRGLRPARNGNSSARLR